MPADEEVGYCKPPKRSRFKPGVSGNPRGRPRRYRERHEIVEILGGSIQVAQNGVVLSMAPFEASIRQLVVRAISKKSLEASIELFRLFEKHQINQVVRASQDSFLRVLTPEQFREELGNKNSGRSEDASPKQGSRRTRKSRRNENNQATEHGTLQRIADEQHSVVENGVKHERSVFELVLLTIRHLSVTGNIRAIRFMHKLVENYAVCNPMPLTIVVLPPKITTEEWISRYGLADTDS